MPASARPPCKWPTIDVAKSIIRRATPPWVRKLPARMKNGIAMISNFSMPVKSFSATDSIGTWVIMKTNVSTVRPSEIEIGMPVSIRAISRPKRIAELIVRLPCCGPRPEEIAAVQVERRRFIDAFDVRDVVVRQLAGPRERPGDLQEAEAHQVRAERDAR